MSKVTIHYPTRDEIATACVKKLRAASAAHAAADSPEKRERARLAIRSAILTARDHGVRDRVLSEFDHLEATEG